MQRHHGDPGSGKSTLVDQLIRLLRDENRRMGVIAIDPSSPFSGGAILGDRIRMQHHHGDPGVLGWEAHCHCASASRLLDVLHCPAS